jgi:shikimate dehydrogenase
VIGARTRWGVVIGDPVEHSLSPAIQNAAFAAAGIDAVFLAMRVAPTDLDAALAFVRAQRPIGVSVTVPHKQAVAERVDELVAPADRIGAVNCLVVRDGRLVG